MIPFLNIKVDPDLYKRKKGEFGLLALTEIKF